MAIDGKKEYQALLVRTEGYAEQVRKLFAKTVNDILALTTSVPQLGDGEVFSYSDNKKIAKKVQDRLRDLHSMVYAAIKEDITLEWDKANEACDELAATHFGKEILSDKRFAGWFERNTEAMEAFISRKEAGLNLSDRVWKPVTQLRSEMELAMTIAIGEGESASQISRLVRQYLNNPDKLFRRVRDKEGNLKLSQAAKAYHPGQGVYRSSAKNAMRIARSETNIAYRQADNTRWQQMDFVLGQEIRLSRSHPVTDICDTLQGRYPKDFVFTGWHPQCYSDDTKVLTDKGWKLFEDVNANDRILSLNPDTKGIEWVDIEDTQCWYKSGDMCHFHNRGLDCLVTPEHRMVYLGKSDGGIKYNLANDFRMTQGSFYRGCNYEGNDTPSITIGDITFDFDWFCAFMGYWLSDGSTIRASQITIAQKDGEKSKPIILKHLERYFRVSDSEFHLDFYSKGLCQYLKRFGLYYQKYVPDEIKGASKRQIRIFLDAFNLCDGSRREPKAFVGNHGTTFTSNKEEILYYTTSEKLAGDICELLLKVGLRPSFSIMTPKESVKSDGQVIRSNYPCYRISECHSITATVFKKEIVRYDGYVYDLTLSKNHIMYVSRNGKCFWGSNCFCYVTPILLSEKDFTAMQQAKLEGKDYDVSDKMVKSMPDNFKLWAIDNKERIEKAKQRGTLPYFIKDNKKTVERIINPPTALETAKERHAARTPEQIKDIKRRWTLRNAEIRHASRTPEQAETIRKAWNDRKATRKYGNSVLSYMGGISDVDTAALRKALSGGNAEKILKEARKLKAVGKEILSYTYIENPIQVAKQFSMADAKAVNEAVKMKLDSFSGFTLEKQKDKLIFETDWVLKHKKYATWEVAYKAYLKQLLIVKDKIDWESINAEFINVSGFKTKSQPYLDLVSKLKAFISAKDKANAKQTLLDIKAKREQLDKAAAKRNTKKLSKNSPFKDEDYSQARKDAAIWDKGDGSKADAALIDTAGRNWQNATQIEKKYTYEYTSHYCDVNEPLQGRKYSNPQSKSRFIEKVNAITSYINKNELPEDMWFMRGDDGLSVIQSRIEFAGGKMPSNIQDLVGMVMQEGGFMSTGSRKGKGFSNKSVIINVYAPKGAKAAYIEPISAYGNGDGISWDGIKRFKTFSNEHETLFQRGTKMRITKVYQERGKTYIDCEVIEQEIKDLSYVKDSNIGY